MSKWQAILGIVLCVGCGAEARSDAQHEDEQTPAVDEPGKEVVPNVIDTLHWKSEEIRFIQVVMEDGTPSVMTTTLGSADEGDILALFAATAKEFMTPAELWIAVTGRSDVPGALARDHLGMTARYGRSPDYQAFPPIAVFNEPRVGVEKAAPLANVLSSFFYPNGQSCWRNPRYARVGNLSACGRYGCSEVQSGIVGPFIGTGAATTATKCPTTYNASGWVRIGVYNDSTQCSTAYAQTNQLCYGPSTDGAWACQAVQFFNANQFFAVNWDIPQQKRMAMSVQNYFADGTNMFGDYFMSATSQIGVPMFGTNVCNDYEVEGPITVRLLSGGSQCLNSSFGPGCN